MTQELFAFVLMPFNEEYNDLYKFGIKDTARGLGIRAERVDEQIYTEGMLERIYSQIRSADIIIADMTEKNTNVFYELGYAHALGKICIHLTKNAENIPFDLRHKRHVVHNGSIEKLKTLLDPELAWAKTIIEKQKENEIIVTLKKADGDGTLNKNEYFSTGSIDFIIDLNNKCNQSTHEIIAIYFYTKNKWKLFQEGMECPVSESDIPDYELRHFVKSNVLRIHKQGWAQLKFRSTKTFGTKFSGNLEECRFPVKGNAHLKIITDKGEYDTKIYIDTEVNDCPF